MSHENNDPMDDEVLRDTAPIDYWAPDTCFGEIGIHVFKRGAGYPCACGARTEGVFTVSMTIDETCAALQSILDRPHATHDDKWYACPKSDDGCTNPSETGCTCGKDADDVTLQAAVTHLRIAGVRGTVKATR